MDHMQALAIILNLNQTVMINFCPHYSQYIGLIKLFGVPSIFILKFFGEILLLFLVSALISIALKLDKASND
jgi:hypothetical protein